MTRERIAELLLRYEATVPQHDPAAQAELHTPDGLWISPSAGKVIGRPAIKKTYEYWFAAFPDLAFELEEMLIDGEQAAAFWKLRGRQEGPFFGLTGSGKRIDVSAAANLYAEGRPDRVPAVLLRFRRAAAPARRAEARGRRRFVTRSEITDLLQRYMDTLPGT